MDLRVTPNLASFSGAGLANPRVAPRPRSSCPASDESLGRPKSRIFRHCFRLISRLPRILALGCASGSTSEFPRISYPLALPPLRLRVTPNPATAAGSMMTPRLASNFASSDKPRMNLLVQSGRAHSRLTLNAFSISIQPSTAGKPAMKSRFKLIRIVLSGWNCDSNSLQGHQLNGE